MATVGDAMFDQSIVEWGRCLGGHLGRRWLVGAKIGQEVTATLLGKVESLVAKAAMARIGVDLKSSAVERGVYPSGQPRQREVTGVEKSLEIGSSGKNPANKLASPPANVGGSGCLAGLEVVTMVPV